jgi:thiamine biosynthesis lipoprotein
MGTVWKITVWDAVDPKTFEELKTSIIKQSEYFDRTYSRFIKTSLIWSLTQKTGIVEVPHDLVSMLRLYEKLFESSQKKLNPLVGFALSDMGYDADYSLTPQQKIRDVPNFHDALRIVDDTHIELKKSVLIDIGAAGKGFFVDTISDFLKENGMKYFLVDGSGDIYYEGDGHILRAGLEHPDDPLKAIGVVEMTKGAMCASGSNRRKWRQYHHIIDPDSLTSPQEIVAAWVLADNAALADGLATCLFLCAPEQLEKDFQFEYCVMNDKHQIKRSKGFKAELF